MDLSTIINLLNTLGQRQAFEPRFDPQLEKENQKWAEYMRPLKEHKPYLFMNDSQPLDPRIGMIFKNPQFMGTMYDGEQSVKYHIDNPLTGRDLDAIIRRAQQDQRLGVKQKRNGML